MPEAVLKAVFGSSVASQLTGLGAFAGRSLRSVFQRRARNDADVIDCLLKSQNTDPAHLRAIIKVGLGSGSLFPVPSRSADYAPKSDRHIMMALLFGPDSQMRIQALGDALAGYHRSQSPLLPEQMVRQSDSHGVRHSFPSEAAKYRVLYRSWLERKLPHQVKAGPAVTPPGTTFDDFVKEGGIIERMAVCAKGGPECVARLRSHRSDWQPS